MPLMNYECQLRLLRWCVFGPEIRGAGVRLCAFFIRRVSKALGKRIQPCFLHRPSRAAHIAADSRFVRKKGACLLGAGESGLFFDI